jgi:hypothetical protein
MNDQLLREFGAEVKAVITTLSEQFGVATEHFYPIFVQQQMYEGLGQLLLTGSIFLNTIVLLLTGVKLRNVVIDQTLPMFSIIFWVLSGFLFIAGCVSMESFPEAFTKIMNPEYHAVQSIMEMVHNK